VIAEATTSTQTSKEDERKEYERRWWTLGVLCVSLVMIVVANHSRGDDIVHFNGLGKRSPFLAFGMLIAMLSLAGIPFTAGFYGKFLVFAAAVQQHHFCLAAIGAITVAAGFYYYLRVVSAMYWQEPNDETKITLNPLTRAVIALLVLAIVVFGIFPQSIIGTLHSESASSAPEVATVR